MASLTLSAPGVKRHLIIKNISSSRLHKPPSSSYRLSFINNFRPKTPPLRCTTKLFPWESSSPYVDDENGIIKQSNIVEPIDTEDSPQLSTIQNQEAIYEMKSQPVLQHQPLKWPMWLLGPSLLLATGMIPTLWLPLSSVFVGPNIAGLLSLVGLDCIFNMGATLFLLMSDSCARSNGGKSLSGNTNQVPFTYKLWNLAASLVGFIVPLLMMFASHKGYFEHNLSFFSFLVLLGPYMLLLSTQVLTETLTWHWKSPVWLLTPIVYEGYRVLQLMRGIQLGIEIGAPQWVVESIRGLVSWWVLVLGIQLMRVAWSAGLDLRAKQESRR